MIFYKKAILPKGFKANGVSAGLKKSGKFDLGLIYSVLPAKASVKFTTNSIPAAPVLVNRKYLKSSRNIQAIVANSGNANAFTGKQGIKDAENTAAAVAAELVLDKQNVLVNSTGIIGKKLDINKIKSAIPLLVKGLSANGMPKASKAIMTTDTFAKEFSVKLKCAKSWVTICGIAKGAGMIAPDMATMLVFIVTDALVTQKALDKALTMAVTDTFNCITVDGCMSTNDSVELLANGASGNPLINTGKRFEDFKKALSWICLELAKAMVRDAEGGTKFITIKVKNAKSQCEAKRLALAIANSNLVKTAMFGQNPNFGRIVSAVGASGVGVREQDIKIKVSPLTKKEIYVEVSVSRGKSEATVYTSDLTYKYVKINAEYN